ncbi:hypothetical protein EC991_009637, partial [Linnemannia zychae]
MSATAEIGPGARTGATLVGVQNRSPGSSSASGEPSLMSAVQHIKPWILFLLNLLLGVALKTILARRQQLDQEQELRQDLQGHHLLAADRELPAPVASASTVKGFKSEAEIHQLRLQVPTWPRLVVGVWFLLMSIDGLNHIYRLT